MTLRQLQEEQKPWVEHNFDSRPEWHPLLGVIEEIGELCHAHLKSVQGIRGTPEEHQAKKRDSVGDIVIYLADFATATQDVLDEPHIDPILAEESSWRLLLHLSKWAGKASESFLLCGAASIPTCYILDVLQAYCYKENINFSDAVIDAWNLVKQRDWKKNKTTGTTTPPEPNSHAPTSGTPHT